MRQFLFSFREAGNAIGVFAFAFLRALLSTLTWIAAIFIRSSSLIISGFLGALFTIIAAYYY